MVLPGDLGDCAQDGDQHRIFACKYGSFKKYMRAPHREVLACRGLVMRGYLAPNGTRRPRGPHKWKAAVTFLAKQGDNGILWNILSYWRATS